GELNYGPFGIGSSGHLNIILLEGMTGTRFTPVHYRGAAPAITDLIGGHIQMIIVSIGLVAQPWQAGALKVLGFGSTERIAQYPDVPTLAESGLPGYEAGSWYGLAAPKGTPRDIVIKLNTQTQRVFDDPGFREKFLAPNFIFSIVSSPEAFAERIRLESAKRGKVSRGGHIKAEWLFLVLARILRSRRAPSAALAIQSLPLSFASASRFISSFGSSSLSTSRNEKARMGLRVPRGWSVRNASRIAPSSKVRRTAISVSRG